MDFFASQEAAKRSSRSLLGLFVVAVIAIAALANLTIYVILEFQTLGTYQFNQELMWQISAGVLILVLAGSAYRIYSLQRGGEAIAAALGGHLLTNGGSNVLEQRLVNVVEEMAIASGLPVPPVYLIDEDGINAFAAGYSVDDAVIGVTRGAVEELTRDQLQGVVAHEFSHIIHGDMRLNVRLVGILHGILMLSFAGKMLLQTRHGVARRSSAAFPVMFLGLSLFLIGYVGKFFGDLIKAGVSRQREYLADASAVQYTRNNAGIAGALKRIGGFVAGSNVHRQGAEEFSHLYFSNSSKRSLMSMLATHPPLEERIERLDPHWDGAYITERPAATSATEEPLVSGFAATASTASVSGAAPQAVTDYTAATVTEAVGTIQPIDVAASILSVIPPALRAAVRETYSVRAVVYGLFLTVKTERREAQDAVLRDHADVFVRARMRELEPLLAEITLEQRLPLLELALPTLRQLSSSEYDRLRKNVNEIMKAAAPISLSEWALAYYLRHHMGDGSDSAGKVLPLQKLTSEVEYLLSTLAHSDSRVHGSSLEAFKLGAQMLELDLTLQPAENIAIPKLEQAVTRLNRLKPLQKPRVLKAFVAVVHSDAHLSPVEVELVRCFADAIDCPLPPLRRAV